MSNDEVTFFLLKKKKEKWADSQCLKNQTKILIFKKQQD